MPPRKERGQEQAGDRVHVPRRSKREGRMSSDFISTGHIDFEGLVRAIGEGPIKKAEFTQMSSPDDFPLTDGENYLLAYRREDCP